MEDKTKIDQESGRPNRDQETEKRPTQGSQDINRQGSVQQDQQRDQQRDQGDRERKSA